jgi:hypothetical protein
MKKILFIALMLVSVGVFSQTKIMKFQLDTLQIDTTNVDINKPNFETFIENHSSRRDFSVQELTGSTPTWNVANGLNAEITMGANTTITLSNLPIGQSGQITVYNGGIVYELEFTGYAISYQTHLEPDSGVVLTTGDIDKYDMFSWYYDGTRVTINGQKGYVK